MEEFLEMSLHAMAFFSYSDDTLPMNKWFDGLYATHPRDKVTLYIDCISKSIENIKEDIQEEGNGRRLASEYYELTPFIRYPFIVISNGIYLVNKYVFFRCLETYVYDLLKRNNSQQFMVRFGDIFESYIEDVLKHTKKILYSEEDIKKALGDKGKQIDFIISEDKSNIFIDAKAIEMSPYGKVTHSPQIIRDKTKTSLLKAIYQANDVLHKIAIKDHQQIRHKNNNYLIVCNIQRAVYKRWINIL